MERKEYNGWTNKATWSVNLVFSSGIGCDIVRNCTSTHDAALALRQAYFDAYMSEDTYKETMRMINEVDWLDLARSYRYDVSQGY